ncbi:hypothetical protein [Sphingomonas sp.]|uniref:hypothetical protein n=1 Tax=Sphingomonas sp. TaxID=28214 RepID=UPI0031CF1A59
MTNLLIVTYPFPCRLRPLPVLIAPSEAGDAHRNRFHRPAIVEALMPPNSPDHDISRPGP